MKRYTIFTKDELWDMLDGKAVIVTDNGNVQHIYVSEEGYDNLKYADDED